MIVAVDITCRETLDVLDRYLEGSLATGRRRRIHRHLAACEPCHRYLRQYQLTIELEKSAFAAAGTDAPESCDAPEELIGAILAARCGR